VIKLQNVTKTYKRGADDAVIALEDVTVEVAKGEFVFVVGPSGSGKSTFMKLLTREQLPDEGEIWVAGKNLAKLRSWKVPVLRREIGYVFQDFKLLDNKTVYENVAFALEVIGRNRREIDKRVPEVLELVGLEDKARAHPHELSGGQQQRVSVARAFVNNPRILLCDEPTGNPRPVHLGGRDEAAGPHQPHRCHGGHGHPRPAHRGLDAATGDRVGERARRPRPVPWRVRLRGLSPPGARTRARPGVSWRQDDRTLELRDP
jgi:cell division transport system ATP-binding protein